MPARGGLCVRLAGLVLVGAALAACGRKGPPLPPLVRVPDAVGQVTVRRLGDDVFVTVALPSENVDGSTPVDLARLEVYASTATSTPTAARLREEGTRVATWVPPDGPEPLPDTITLREVLEPGAVTPPGAAPDAAVPPDVPVPPDVVVPRDAEPSPDDAPEADAGPGAEGEPTVSRPARYYVVVPYGDRGRAGPPGRVVSLPLTEPPAPPVSLAGTYDARSVTLTWRPAAPAADDEAIRFDVYQLQETAAAPGEAAVTPPAARNASPLEETSFAEPLPLDGARRCYEVRAVRGTGQAAVAGPPSPEACITAVDTFPPPAPTGLTAIELQGAIDLTWAPVEEPDLGGYLVLRGEPGDATLAAVTAEPITETRFLDRDVSPGVRYTYAVVAVDTQPQPNVSAESARLERTAR